MSTTCFVNKPWTFSTIYGCTTGTVKRTTASLKQFKRSAFHPLMLPMVFMEHERRRLLNTLDTIGPQLDQKILDLENRLRLEDQAVTQATQKFNRTMTQKDCEGTKMWVSVSHLKNGLESLRHILPSMIDHCQALPKDSSWPVVVGNGVPADGLACSNRFEARLYEMIAELESKIRKCDGLLSGMALATQVVGLSSNYRTIESWLNCSTGMELPHKARCEGKYHHSEIFQERQHTDATHLACGNDFPSWNISCSRQNLVAYSGLD